MYVTPFMCRVLCNPAALIYFVGEQFGACNNES
jgi:hypothetical protein